MRMAQRGQGVVSGFLDVGVGHVRVEHENIRAEHGGVGIAAHMTVEADKTRTI